MFSTVVIEMFEDEFDIDEILELGNESTNNCSKRLSSGSHFENTSKKIKLDSDVNHETIHNPATKQKVFRFKRKDTVTNETSFDILKLVENEEELKSDIRKKDNISSNASKETEHCLVPKDQLVASSAEKCDVSFKYSDESVVSSRTTPDVVKNCSSLRIQSEGSAAKRRFPGPAGLLPDGNPSTVNSENNTLKTETKDNVCYQSSSMNFSDKLWELMMSDWTTEINLPEKYNIGWIKSRMVMKKLINQKTPFLAASIDSIKSHTIQNPIVNIVLKDRTGTINGTILYSLYDEYVGSITVGSIIVLKDVGVLNIGLNGEPYLTITRNNLLVIYSNSRGCGDGSPLTTNISKTIVQNLSANEILGKIREMKIHEFESSKNTILMDEDVIVPKNFSDTLKMAVKKSDKNSLNVSFPRTKSTVGNSSKSTDKKGENSLKCSKNDNEHLNELKNFFENNDCIDEFFELEPNSTSTQKESNAVTVTKTEDRVSENSKIFEDLFDGVDASALFDEF